MASNTFSSEELLPLLEGMSSHELDQLDFGVVRMDANGEVIEYNTYESNLSGLLPDTVVGANFWTQVAPCTNNFMVAYRFETETAIDETIDYLFTFGMRPTKVKLRLLKGEGTHSYLLVSTDRPISLN